MARPKGGSNWTLTYGDMVTLLMLFFVVLWSTARLDLEKYQRVAEAMRTTFGGAGGGQIFDVMGTEAGTWVSEYSRPVQMQLPMVNYDQRDVSAALGSMVARAGLEGQISVRTHIEGVIVSLSEELVFPAGSAELQQQGQEALDRIAHVLAEMGNNPIRVEGHTDDRPTGNPLYPTNWELSTARAIAIVRYLEERGIDPARLSATGCASYRPLYPNDSAENRRRNRRAEIIVIYPLEQRELQVQVLPELRELAHPITGSIE